MAEEIRVDRGVATGFVESRRAPETPLEGLGRALNAAGRTAASGLNFAGQLADKELREAENALSSPTITEEEVNEIREGSTFPLAKYRAANRLGELRVMQRMPEIEDAVAKAPDVLASRDILRKLQSEMLEGVDDPAVAAGIRERFATAAPTLLAEASRRRIETRERTERVTVDESLRLALENSGAIGLASEVVGMMTEDGLSGGDATALVDSAVTTIENHWLTGDDEDPNDNVFAEDSLDAIDTLLTVDTITGPERKKLTKLRQRIEQDEEASRRRLATEGSEAATAAQAQAFQRILDFQRDNPDTRVPDSLREAYIQTGHTAANKESARQWLRENVASEGVLDTPIWQEGAGQVKAMFNLQAQSVGGAAAGGVNAVELALNPALLVHAQNVYRQIGAALPRDLEGDALRAAQQKAVADSIAAAQAVQVKQAEANAFREKLLDQRRALGRDIPGVKRNDAVIAKKQAAIDRQMRESMGLSVKIVANNWLILNGYSPLDFDNPLE